MRVSEIPLYTLRVSGGLQDRAIHRERFVTQEAQGFWSECRDREDSLSWLMLLVGRVLGFILPTLNI